MSFPIYLHKDFIQVPFPITRLKTPCPTLFDLACELRAKPMPPAPNGFITNIYAPFMKEVFHVSQWERKSHLQHDCKLNDLGAGFKIAKGYRIGHSFIANNQGSPQQEGLF